MSGYGMSVNDTTIWWQVYPLGFTGRPDTPVQRGRAGVDATTRRHHPVA